MLGTKNLRHPDKVGAGRKKDETLPSSALCAQFWRRERVECEESHFRRHEEQNTGNWFTKENWDCDIFYGNFLLVDRVCYAKGC